MNGYVLCFTLSTINWMGVDRKGGQAKSKLLRAQQRYGTHGGRKAKR